MLQRAALPPFLVLALTLTRHEFVPRQTGVFPGQWVSSPATQGSPAKWVVPRPRFLYFCYKTDAGMNPKDLMAQRKYPPESMKRWPGNEPVCTGLYSLISYMHCKTLYTYACRIQKLFIKNPPTLFERSSVWDALFLNLLQGNKNHFINNN